VKRFLLILSFLVLVAAPVAPPVAVAGKIPVKSLTDLPVRSYSITGSVSEMLDDEAAMKDLAEKVRADIESMLEKYDIKDDATLKNLYRTLATLDLMEGRNEEALAFIDKAKELETKESARLMAGISVRALIAARKAGPEGSDAYRQTYRQTLQEELEALPWDVVQDDVQQQKGMTEILSANLLKGMIASQIDPIVAQSHELSGDLADRVLGIAFALQTIIPLQEERIAAYSAVVEAHKEEKPNIWPEREWTLSEDEHLTPVVIGIWDSGVDITVFPDQLWTNPKETENGKDDDGNGFVDDLHGIAFDLDGEVSPYLLHPLGDQEGKVDTAMHYMKGLMDLQAAIDSKEAAELRSYLSKLPADEVDAFMTSLSFVGLYAHGTHVAGIALRGNPYGRILVDRITFDYHSVPAPITKERALRHAASYAASAEYFKKAQVRVVNMSWGWSFKEIESSLEANGIGKDAEERKAMAEEIFGILDEALHAAMASCPDILFVVAAGNADSDVGFHRNIPSSYELPNLLVVGAVDQAGERTGFTSMGKNVVVYANGFEVESTVPGGKKMKMSGTSMASPNTLNLAAKMVAYDPTLTPQRIIELIEKAADQLPDQPELKLINPKATAELLMKH